MAQLRYQFRQPDVIAYVKCIVGKFFPREGDRVLVNIDSTIDVMGKMLFDKE